MTAANAWVLYCWTSVGAAGCAFCSSGEDRHKDSSLLRLLLIQQCTCGCVWATNCCAALDSRCLLDGALSEGAHQSQAAMPSTPCTFAVSHCAGQRPTPPASTNSRGNCSTWCQHAMRMQGAGDALCSPASPQAPLLKYQGCCLRLRSILPPKG